MAPEPIIEPDDQDQTVTTPSGKKAVLPPPPGKSSPMYNAEPDKDSDSPYTSDFLKRFDPDATKGLTTELAGIERERGAAEQKQFSSIDARLDRDRAQMERAFHAEAQSANSIPPEWNADRERQNRIADPIQNFGSLASIFGILASQFTRKPLTSALNASAAAMTAIRAHDEEGYKSAYQAWKDNTELALKRFGMEREMFEDANKLISTDLAQWKVKQLAIASQFDNKKTIAMLDAGMDDKVLEMQAAQIRAAEGIQKAREDFETYDIRRSIFSSEVKAWDADHPDAKPNQRAAARLQILQGIAEGGRNLQVDLLRQYRLEHPEATAEQEATFLMQHPVGLGTRGAIGGAPTKQREIQRRMDSWVAAQKAAGHEPTEDEYDEHYDQVSREIANASQPSMSPNKRVDIERNITQYEEADKTLDKAIHVLETYVGAAGLAGRVTRLGERLQDVFSKSKTGPTDRVQFMRDIEYLQTAAQKLLFDRTGRPLAADADRISGIIAGLSLGDTTANTLRDLRDVKERLQRLKKSQEDQLSGKWTPGTSEPDAKPKSGKPAWEEAPIVGGP